ncbi:FMN-binding protein [Sansalvadorimonas verongulae]|uniref:FMN-binding protein n=1 Tax=Sansalvadorimonas verongulae TaxID=2172824 RepID=UPI0012BBEF16|nr:FMN-binding protein [Sansalvadorimonas verongulae]MTI15406.1 FMN-binding protein [Sansalvadorimonas verongulae]
MTVKYHRWGLPLAMTLIVAALSGCSDKTGSKNQQAASPTIPKEEVVYKDSRRVLLDVANLGRIHKSASELLKTYIDPKLVTLSTGEVSTDPEAIARFEKQTAENTVPADSLNPAKNLVRLNQRPKQVELFVVKNEQGEPRSVVVPIAGQGYISLLKGYLALNIHTLKIEAIRFYQQGETPAKGGHIMTDDAWLAQFPGKRVWINDQPQFRVTDKRGQRQDDFTVDALAGATMTSRGVENMINYWLGDKSIRQALLDLQQS